MGVLTKVRKNSHMCCWAGVIMASPGTVSTALADAGRFYLGITGTPEWLDTSVQKDRGQYQPAQYDLPERKGAPRPRLC